MKAVNLSKGEQIQRIQGIHLGWTSSYFRITHPTKKFNRFLINMNVVEKLLNSKISNLFPTFDSDFGLQQIQNQLVPAVIFHINADFMEFWYAPNERHTFPSLNYRFNRNNYDDYYDEDGG